MRSPATAGGQLHLQEQLHSLRDHHRRLDRDITLAIIDARHHGLSDDWIAGCLGVTAAALRTHYNARRAAARILAP